MGTKVSRTHGLLGEGVDGEADWGRPPHFRTDNGMPSIGCNFQPLSLGVALRNVVASIALQEAAMVHVLNAEGEK